MKNMERKLLAVLTAVFLLVCFTVPAAFAVSYDKVASASDMTTVEEVGVEGMEPIEAKDVENGTYDVEMESSSSMFKITAAKLTVLDDAMSVKITLSGTSYPYLFAGTAKEAAKLNDTSKYISAVEEDGAYTYEVPVPALDDSFSVAAFSKNKEQWYDRNLLVNAGSLPDGAVKVELPDYEALEKAAQEKRIEEKKAENTNQKDDGAVQVSLHNGSYNIEVDMEGGSGKASITSPTTMTVINGKAYATIQWSSPNYDYMIVNGQKITPQNIEEGSNSSFLIPILSLDEPFTVIADTTAMSTPHEIEYTLTFHEDTIHRYSSSLLWFMLLALVICVAFGFGVYYFWVKDWTPKKKK